MLALYSILASTTPSNLRTTRIGFLHVVTTGGWVAGNLLAPLVFHKWSYYGTFASSLLVALLSLLITCIALKDQPTVSSPSSELSSSSSSWSCSGRLLQAWRCMVAPRPARPSLLLLLAGLISHQHYTQSFQHHPHHSRHHDHNIIVITVIIVVVIIVSIISNFLMISDAPLGGC